MLSLLPKNTLSCLLLGMALLFTVNNAQAHSGPLSEIAVKSCNEKERSDACQYEGGHQDLYIGTCQYMSTVLMCVRNQPIQIIEEKQNKAAETHVHNE